MLSYPSYDEYQETGIPWLPSAPKDWLVRRGKWSHDFRKEINRNMQCDNVLSLTLRGVVNNKIENPEGLVPQDYKSYQVFEKDDLVFKLIDLENYKTSRVGLVHEKGIMSPAYLRLVPNATGNSKYYYYFYFSLYLQGVYNRLGAGVRSTLNQNDLLDIPVLEPSLETQTRIANFLDQKTQEIDAAISKKQQLIELLKEQKAILINQAVTKGLNTDAPMRDSGVEWIGEIPEHWSCSKINHYAVVTNGSTPSRDVSRYWSGGTIPWLSSGKVNDYVITTPSEYVTENALRECSIRLYPKGTVLIGIVGQGKTRGTSALLQIEAAINQNVAGIIPREKLFSEYLHRYLVQAYQFIRNYGKGSNQEALNCEIVGAFKIVVPPLDEQKEIVKYLVDVECQLNKLIELASDEIETLIEFKKTLIANAVTGKIKI